MPISAKFTYLWVLTIKLHSCVLHWHGNTDVVCFVIKILISPSSSSLSSQYPLHPNLQEYSDPHTKDTSSVVRPVSRRPTWLLAALLTLDFRKHVSLFLCNSTRPTSRQSTISWLESSLEYQTPPNRQHVPSETRPVCWNSCFGLVQCTAR